MVLKDGVNAAALMVFLCFLGRGPHLDGVRFLSGVEFIGSKTSRRCARTWSRIASVIRSDFGVDGGLGVTVRICSLPGVDVRSAADVFGLDLNSRSVTHACPGSGALPLCRFGGWGFVPITFAVRVFLISGVDVESSPSAAGVVPGLRFVTHACPRLVALPL